MTSDDVFSRALTPATLSRTPAYAPRPQEVTLNGANPLLTITTGYVRFTLGPAATGGIVLSAGTFVGQHVVLECTAQPGTTNLPNLAASRVKLSASWSPTSNDTLQLVWNGHFWLQLSRSANAA